MLRGLLIDPTSNPVIYLAALAGLTVVNYLGAGLLLAVSVVVSILQDGGLTVALVLSPWGRETRQATQPLDGREWTRDRLRRRRYNPATHRCRSPGLVFDLVKAPKDEVDSTQRQRGLPIWRGYRYSGKELPVPS